MGWNFAQWKKSACDCKRYPLRPEIQRQHSCSSGLPFIQAGNGVTILQQDNARPHTARATTQFLTANNVNVMEWPSMSPDLSPIEHI